MRVSPHFNGHFFQANLSQPVLLELRIMERVVTTGDRTCKAPVKSRRENKNACMYCNNNTAVSNICHF